MNNQNGKMLKMSKILNTILKIGGIMLIMGMMLQIVFVIIAPSLDIKSGGPIIDVWGSYMTLDGSVGNFRALMFVTMLGSGIMAAILLVASFIFKDISREGTPFTKKNSNKIRGISILLIAQCIVIPPLQLLAVKIFTSTTNASDAYNINLNLGFIIVPVIFFCLAQIFEYGAELQRQSDETL